MIISHKYKFIFLKTRKTAGTSIEMALSEHCGDDDIISFIAAPDEKHRAELGYKTAQNQFSSFKHYGIKDWERFLLRRKKKVKFFDHIWAVEIKEGIGEKIWNSYFKFCFERNPWDKVISFYYFYYKEKPRPSFAEYLKTDMWKGLDDYDRYSIDGKIVVDFIGQYENLNEDLASICKRLSIPELHLPRAKAGFREDQRHYREIFSEEQNRMIKKTFARSIAEFHYKF